MQNRPKAWCRYYLRFKKSIDKPAVITVTEPRII